MFYTNLLLQKNAVQSLWNVIVQSSNGIVGRSQEKGALYESDKLKTCLGCLAV